MTATQKADPKPERQEFRVLPEQYDGRATLTVPEAAEILGISVWCGWQAVKEGQLPVIRIGRRTIVPRMAIERLLTVT